jgi:hypothetical protein
MLVLVDWKLTPPTPDTARQTTISGKHYPNRARFSDLSFYDHESYRARRVEQATSDTQVRTSREKRLGLPPPVGLEECLRAYAGADELLEDASW